MNLFLWMLVQWTSQMCPFHISKDILGDRYTLIFKAYESNVTQEDPMWRKEAPVKLPQPLD